MADSTVLSHQAALCYVHAVSADADLEKQEHAIFEAIENITFPSGNGLGDIIITEPRADSSRNLCRSLRVGIAGANPPNFRYAAQDEGTILEDIGKLTQLTALKLQCFFLPSNGQAQSCLR